MSRALHLLFTLNISKIISKNNLKIIDFHLNEINGGSIEVICAKKKVDLNQI